MSETTVDALCEVMHDAYEAAAVEAGWETQERSRKPWADVPEANKATMRAAVRAMLESPHVEAMLDRARAEPEWGIRGERDGWRARAEGAEAERDRLAGEVGTLRARLAAVEAWADVQARPFADGIPDREGEAVAASLRAALEVEP